MVAHLHVLEMMGFLMYLALTHCQFLNCCDAEEDVTSQLQIGYLESLVRKTKC